jgi:hypothetical protein
MLDLMAVSNNDGPMPLYLHIVYRILQDMRIEQQETGGTFSYSVFKKKITSTAMTPAQLVPLNQRLETLESFMPKARTDSIKKNRKAKNDGNNWACKVCTLALALRACLIDLAWLSYNCRSFMPMRYARGSLLTL